MYTRQLTAPNSSFFLFGPRGTGKTTWLRQHFPSAVLIDLLPPENTIKYAAEPALMRHEVLRYRPEDWIVVDEIQRVPELLDEVHNLMENYGYRRFALTGSSARKLKRGAANLLAGRAITRNLGPLTGQEVGLADYDLDQYLSFGLLPLSVTADGLEAREDFLRSYLVTYLSQEIKAEALVKNIGSFTRFLRVAALCAGQQVNISAIAREAMLSRDAVYGYFEVLEDTLIGSWLPAYRPRAKVKESFSPKFYWFDSGVLYAASGGLEQPLPADFQGILLETLIHHELKSFMEYHRIKGSLGFWRTPSGSEVDFVWWYGDRAIAIEVKSAHCFRSDQLDGIRALRRSKLRVTKAFVVYRGDAELEVDGVNILPVRGFLNQLYSGELLKVEETS